MRLAGIPRNLSRNFKLKSCVVRILVSLRWTAFLLSAFFITTAKAAPGDKTVHDGWLDRVARQIPGEDVMQLVALASRTPRSVLG